MPRRMSCSMTIDAVRERRKTVTRRHVDTWRTLTPGDRLTLIEKGMGLAKGERQVVLAEVEVDHISVEPLSFVTTADVMREGLFDEGVAAVVGTLTPVRVWFIRYWLTGHGYPHQADPDEIEVRRIEWRYLDDCDQ